MRPRDISSPCRTRLDGTPATEWKHLHRALAAAREVAVHVRVAQLEHGTGSIIEVCMLSSGTS
jgi:hypothetical protein